MFKTNYLKRFALVRKFAARKGYKVYSPDMWAGLLYPEPLLKFMHAARPLRIRAEMKEEYPDWFKKPEPEEPVTSVGAPTEPPPIPEGSTVAPEIPKSYCHWDTELQRMVLPQRYTLQDVVRIYRQEFDGQNVQDAQQTATTQATDGTIRVVATFTRVPEYDKRIYLVLLARVGVPGGRWIVRDWRRSEQNCEEVSGL